MAAQPWPVVGECLGHKRDESCAQCDGSHEHLWAKGEDHGYGAAVRCRCCGARKCDRPDCMSRRHHRDPHITFRGTVVAIGR